MAFGSVYHHLIKPTTTKAALLKIYIKVFGVPELHSHIRWRAIKSYIQNGLETIDLGAGIGLMTLEIAKKTKSKVIGVVYEVKDVYVAEYLLEHSKLKNVFFLKGGLPYDLPSEIRNKKYDQVLLIDVLEHIDKDVESLQSINRLLKLGGYLIISVPTPSYPKYFGMKFDKEIGHIRHYDINRLKSLLTEAGFEIISWKYHTNFIGSKLCEIWYKKFNGNRKYDYIFRLILLPLFVYLSYFDIFGKGKYSSGITLKAIKVKDL